MWKSQVVIFRAAFQTQFTTFSDVFCTKDFYFSVFESFSELCQRVDNNGSNFSADHSSSHGCSFSNVVFFIGLSVMLRLPSVGRALAGAAKGGLAPANPGRFTCFYFGGAW